MDPARPGGPAGPGVDDQSRTVLQPTTEERHTLIHEPWLAPVECSDPELESVVALADHRHMGPAAIPSGVEGHSLIDGEHDAALDTIAFMDLDSPGPRHLRAIDADERNPAVVG